MSAAQSDAVDAIGFQLLAALEKYEADVAAMIGSWPDLDRYREVSEQVEHIRMYSSALQEVRVQWVEVLITHAELVHVLWKAQYGRPDGAREKIETVRSHHADAVLALRNRCLRILARSQHADS
jgi:hypothetical protein